LRVAQPRLSPMVRQCHPPQNLIAASASAAPEPARSSRRCLWAKLTPGAKPMSRVVKDNMIGLRMPDIDVRSDRVVTVLGQNPGPFTGPGTNTYLVGTSRRPLLLDTGQGKAEWLPLLLRALDEHRGGSELQEVVLTHAHPDHLGGCPQVRERFG